MKRLNIQGKLINLGINTKNYIRKLQGLVVSKIDLIKGFISNTTYDDYLDWKGDSSKKLLITHIVETSINNISHRLLVGLGATLTLSIYGVVGFSLWYVIANTILYWLLGVLVDIFKGERQ